MVRIVWYNPVDAFLAGERHLIRHYPRCVTVIVIALLLTSCMRKYREDLQYDYNVLQTWTVDELPNRELVQFESVFWESDDTTSLRRMIAQESIAENRDCLEIGTGTGLLSILCLHHGAKSVVATDINQAAVDNARYNAAMLRLDRNLEVRKISLDQPGAFAVIKDSEKFDLIVSNPPWEDAAVSTPAEHAYYDPNFGLMDSLLDGLPDHLRVDGRCLLAYGHRPAIERLLTEASKRGFTTKILDDRKLAELNSSFLPGMLIEIKCPSLVSAPPRDGEPATTSD